jgi:hypothetical protein
MNKMHKIHFIFKNFTFTLGHGKVEFENVIKNKGAGRNEENEMVGIARCRDDDTGFGGLWGQ